MRAIRSVVLGTIIAALTGCASTTVVEARGLALEVPVGWIEEETTSEMRAAQFLWPAGEGDTRQTRLVVYHFGERGGGSIEANLERWRGQFEPGAVERSAEYTTASGARVHAIDLTGTYIAETRPGSGEHVNEPGHRVLAAIIEHDGGPYYIKVSGPEATVSRWKSAYDRMMASVGQ